MGRKGMPFPTSNSWLKAFSISYCYNDDDDDDVQLFNVHLKVHLKVDKKPA